jgi:hypothetical protein
MAPTMLGGSSAPFIGQAHNAYPQTLSVPYMQNEGYIVQGIIHYAARSHSIPTNISALPWVETLTTARSNIGLPLCRQLATAKFASCTITITYDTDDAGEPMVW